MAIRSRKVSAGGRQLAYAQCASPEPRGLPLVFVHGAGGDRHSWLPLMVRLARAALRFRESL
ncbi:MAG: alpha/beta fold hydrolase [Nitrospinota bacterium]